MTATPTLTPTRTLTATPTATPRIVHIDIGSGIGRPGDPIDVTVALTTSGAQVAATGNDITFNKQVLSLDPSACRVNPAIHKALAVSVLPETQLTRSVRVFVQADDSAAPIPDGPLYTCTFTTASSTLPAVYTLTNSTTIAFDPDGQPLDDVVGADGAVNVSLVVVKTATPTATATASPTPPLPTATSTPDRCPHTLTLQPTGGPAGIQVTLNGQCNLIRAGRRATVFFDAAVVGMVTGDALGGYRTMFIVPPSAALGTHLVRVVASDEIASGTFAVTGPACPGDCNGDQEVTVTELLAVADIALGNASIESCPAGSTNDDRRVSIDGLLRAIDAALEGGCDGATAAP